MNWKNIIFSIGLLINFQTILYSMEKTQEIVVLSKQEKLSKKIERIEKSLDFLEVEPEKRKEIVEYFSNTDSTPIFIKHSQQAESKPFLSLSTIANISCELLLGYPSKELQDTWHLEKLRRNNCYYLSDKEYADRKIDKKSTEIASKLFKKSNLDPKNKVPIFKNDFCYNNSFDGFWKDLISHCSDSTTYHCYITMNSLLNKKFPDTIDFSIGHEISHAERGLTFPYINLLLAKAILGTAGVVASYTLFKNGPSRLHALAGLEGIIFANLFKGYFSQAEEKACDLRALELLGSDKGVKDFFSLKPIITDQFSGNNWTIQKMKIEQLSEPEEYTTWRQKLFATHPSDAARLRYCQEYVKYIKQVKTLQVLHYLGLI